MTGLVTGLRTQRERNKETEVKMTFTPLTLKKVAGSAGVDGYHGTNARRVLCLHPKQDHSSPGLRVARPAAHGNSRIRRS